MRLRVSPQAYVLHQNVFALPEPLIRQSPWDYPGLPAGRCRDGETTNQAQSIGWASLS